MILNIKQQSKCSKGVLCGSSQTFLHKLSSHNKEDNVRRRIQIYRYLGENSETGNADGVWLGKLSYEEKLKCLDRTTHKTRRMQADLIEVITIFKGLDDLLIEYLLWRRTLEKC